MAKAYVNAVKYEIQADFEINGIVEKHDIIGAVFGQSEGLLGEEMDLRELQKGGRIGRIEVDSRISNGKTSGKLTVPSSLDSIKTSLLAAAIESVDKVGPCDCKFTVQGINDTRSSKREEIKKRAAELLNKLMIDQQPETAELADQIRGEVRTAELVPWGPERLPAGPDVETSDDLIVVEGRADVINLLKHGVKNVIGMDGANIPSTLAELSKRKKMTLFIDGDRGGLINLRNARARLSIENVARAPDGKEVEELVGKEIVLALRKTMSVDEALEAGDNAPSGEFNDRRRGGRDRDNRRGGRNRDRRSHDRGGRSHDRMGQGDRDGGRGRRSGRNFGGRDRNMGRSFDPEREFASTSNENASTAPPVDSMPAERSNAPMQASEPAAEVFVPVMRELANSLRARFLGPDGHVIDEVNVRDLLAAMSSHANSSAVVFDGILTKRLVDEAAKHGIMTLVGVKKGKFDAPEGMNLYTVQ